MSPSLRFLTFVILGWTGFRAASMGAIPVSEIFSIDRSAAQTASLPPIVPTIFPPIDPPPEDPAALVYDPARSAPLYPRPTIPIEWLRQLASWARPTIYRVGPQSTPADRSDDGLIAFSLPASRAAYYPATPRYEDSPYSRLAALASPPLANAGIMATPPVSFPAETLKPRLDRLQLSAWALLRGRQGMQSGPASIAPGGSLGASQAGARLTYNVTRELAATLRTSTTVGRRGGEVAAGLRYQPLQSLPIWINAERRQRIGRFSDGRNAFAVYLEGGLYDRPLPWDFRLDAYFQGGIVGFRRRDRFADGAMTITRPVYKQLSAGVGVWGAAQPHLYRVDAGPRVTYRVRNNIKIHLDYRQHLAGNAQPGSGPAVTLAADF